MREIRYLSLTLAAMLVFAAVSTAQTPAVANLQLQWIVCADPPFLVALVRNLHFV